MLYTATVQYSHRKYLLNRGPQKKMQLLSLKCFWRNVTKFIFVHSCIQNWGESWYKTYTWRPSPYAATLPSRILTTYITLHYSQLFNSKVYVLAYLHKNQNS